MELPNGVVLTKHISVIPGIGESRAAIAAKIKRKGGHHRFVRVMNPRLRGKFDLHGKPYRPSAWIMTDVDID